MGVGVYAPCKANGAQRPQGERRDNRGRVEWDASTKVRAIGPKEEAYEGQSSDAKEEWCEAQRSG